MSDRYIPGVPCWIDSMQPDPAAAADFYGALFGWELEDVMPPDAPGRYFMARLPGGDVGAIGSAPEGMSTAVWNTYIWVESADETAAKVREAGGTVLQEPFDVFDAGRMAICADPEGAPFSVWQAGRNRGADVVNEPGSLNFNVLNTRDVERAAKFYGAVFGWDVIDVGGTPMWALPAYADFLEARTPGTLQGAAEMGAPPRFMEVVAAAVPAWGRPARHPGALEPDLRRRRRRRGRREGGRARRHRPDAAVRRAVGAHDRDPRPAGRDVHGQQVRAREQGPPQQRGRRDRRLISLARMGSEAAWSSEPTSSGAGGSGSRCRTGRAARCRSRRTARRAPA